MIFPEGSHDRRRTIRPISKGFTRILFGALDKYPNLEIHVIPVGVTYQNASQFPSKVAIHYGKPILANQLYNPKELNKSIGFIKEAVANQLKELSVHIPLDENYHKTQQQLNESNIDFTNVTAINESIKTNKIVHQKQKINFAKPFYFLIVINSLFPWLIWKLISKKIDEIEFVDTFRFALGVTMFPLFYLIQAYVIYNLYDLQIAFLYFIASISIVLLYSKLSTTPTE
jgi:hypothetical protein